MRICLHIGLEQAGAPRLQEVLDAKRKQLEGMGILFPRAPGKRNHTTLYMAVTDPDRVDPLRQARGYARPEAQEKLRNALFEQLRQDIDRVKPEVLILSAAQLATLPRRSEIERLRDFLLPLSDQIALIAHLDEQARVLARHYARAVMEGRSATLKAELSLAGKGTWRQAALAGWGENDPASHGYGEVQAVPHWLDYAALRHEWETVFGKGAVSFRPYDPALFASPDVTGEIRAAFGIKGNIGRAEEAQPAPLPSAEWLARGRLLNEVLIRITAKGRQIPRPMWQRFMEVIATGGTPIEPGALHPVSTAFEAENKNLSNDFPALSEALTPDAPLPDWREAAPGGGFRATQYAAAFLPLIETATRQEQAAQAHEEAAAETPLSPDAEKLLPPRAREIFVELATGRFAPHNQLGRADEAQEGLPYDPAPKRELPPDSTGRVIVGCMKNEAPYILEWIAHHRAIGVDDFIIYTNDCDDGTDAILSRLEELGIARHRRNDDWKGNSPQQHALNRSLKEDAIQRAEWIIHIDVDEFINVRFANGTLDDFLGLVPEATNVAMTWRMFGHNDVVGFEDELVTDQFDRAGPRYCPKPHTAWGFKTMTRNIGAYHKLSCHRPNGLDEDRRAEVAWVNGNARLMGDEVKTRGWRSSLRTVGFDLLQLNHYPLRSAESFLIKRQRGRALHVDRSIGLNYWIRMDWSDHADVTIKRNLPRVRAELARLLADDELAALHRAGVDWHRAKAAELRANPEFAELFEQARRTRLTATERAAYSLALDLES